MRAYSSHNKTNKPTLRLGLANQTKRRSAFAIVLSQDATKFPVDAFNCLKIKTSYNNNAFGQTDGMNKKSIYVLTPSGSILSITRAVYTASPFALGSR